MINIIAVSNTRKDDMANDISNLKYHLGYKDIQQSDLMHEFRAGKFHVIYLLLDEFKMLVSIGQLNGLSNTFLLGVDDKTIVHMVCPNQSDILMISVTEFIRQFATFTEPMIEDNLGGKDHG